MKFPYSFLALACLAGGNALAQSAETWQYQAGVRYTVDDDDGRDFSVLEIAGEALFAPVPKYPDYPVDEVRFVERVGSVTFEHENGYDSAASPQRRLEFDSDRLSVLLMKPGLDFAGRLSYEVNRTSTNAGEARSMSRWEAGEGIDAWAIEGELMWYASKTLRLGVLHSTEQADSWWRYKSVFSGFVPLPDVDFFAARRDDVNRNGLSVRYLGRRADGGYFSLMGAYLRTGAEDNVIGDLSDEDSYQFRGRAYFGDSYLEAGIDQVRLSSFGDLHETDRHLISGRYYLDRKNYLSADLSTEERDGVRFDTYRVSLRHYLTRALSVYGAFNREREHFPPPPAPFVGSSSVSERDLASLGLDFRF